MAVTQAASCCRADMMQPQQGPVNTRLLSVKADTCSATASARARDAVAEVMKYYCGCHKSANLKPQDERTPRGRLGEPSLPLRC